MIDVDPRHGGLDSLAELEATSGPSPRAAVVETPSGGTHLYLTHPGWRVPNSQGRLGPGLDVRGDGGLALLPPSCRHGDAYRWASGGPSSVPAMPDAWAALLRPKPRRPATAPRLGHGTPHTARLAGVLRVLEQAPEGQRNGVLYWAGCRLAEMLAEGAPRHWVEVLEQAGRARGLGQAEVRDTIASALGRAEP